MSNIVNLDDVKAELKNKWLDYWAENRDWMVAFCNSAHSRWCQFKDSGEHKRRPKADIILVIIAVLIPEFSQSWLETLCLLNGDENKILEALGLNFDPDVELENREEEQKKQKMLLSASPLDDIRQMAIESKNSIN